MKWLQDFQRENHSLLLVGFDALRSCVSHNQNSKSNQVDELPTYHMFLGHHLASTLHTGTEMTNLLIKFSAYHYLLILQSRTNEDFQHKMQGARNRKETRKKKGMCKWHYQRGIIDRYGAIKFARTRLRILRCYRLKTLEKYFKRRMKQKPDFSHKDWQPWQ